MNPRFQYKYIIVMLLSGLTAFTACKNASHETPLRIALSSGTENYINWIHRGDSTAVIVDLKSLPADSAVQLLKGCDAIVFTGGEDVQPAYYGKAFDSARCACNPGRDSLEMALIREAFKLKMPVFGICRGQQILNVALGGTLIVDIPTDHPGNVIHRMDDYLRCFHNITAVKGSHLYNTAGADSGMVTSSHHQAIEKTAPGLRIVARSNDSIIESVEWADPSGKSFLMAVQWHPERMDVSSPFSLPLVKDFLKAAGIYKNSR